MGAAPRTTSAQPAVNTTDDAAPRLRFEGVGLTFPDGTAVLRDVDLDIRPGEFVSVIGPSGCGKSTLLRLASGLLRATRGTVDCDRADIGYVFQDPTLLPWRTVRDNVELFAELHGMRRSERRSRAAEALALVGLEGFESKYPKALSGGMRSRVSLARSLMLHPTLFLFDEPFAAIDEINRQRLNDQLMQLFVMERFAAVFVTHSITEACYLASKVVVMTQRPAAILDVVEVPFSYPRAEELRFDERFVEISKRVSDLLAASHHGSPGAVLGSA